MNEKDKPLTKGDLQTILDHVTTERQNAEKYVNEELNKVNDKVDALQKGVSNLKRDMTQVKKDVGTLKTDMTQVKEDVNTIATDLGMEHDEKGRVKKSA